MSVSPEVKHLASVKQHRRTVWLQMIVPILGVGVLIVALVIALVVPFSPLYLADTEDQISIISNLLVSLFVLCPMVLCLLVFFVILVFATLGLHWSQGYSAKQMRRVQLLSRKTADKTASIADNLSKQSIRYNTRFAFFNRIFNIFDQSTTQNDVAATNTPEEDLQDE